MTVEIRGPMYWYLRRWLFEARVSPYDAMTRVMYHLNEGHLTQEEARELLDMPLPQLLVNAPGGSC